MLDLFTRHPKEVGMTYLGHFRFAITVGGTLVYAGLACIFHGVFTFWLKTTASSAIKRLHKKIEHHPEFYFVDGEGI